MSAPPHDPPGTAAALQRALSAARENPFLRHLFDDPSRFLAVLDLAGVIVDLNAYDPGQRPPREAYIGRPIWTTSAFGVDPSWETTWKQRLADAAAAGPLLFEDDVSPRGFERTILRGRLSLIEGGADPNGGSGRRAPLGYFLEFDDVRTERQTEARLREQERLRQLVFDQSFQLMVLLAPDGTIIDVNAAVERVGLTRNQVLGRRMQDVARLESDGEERSQIWQERIDAMQSAHEPVVVSDTRPSDAKGDLLAHDCCMTPVRDDSGALAMILLELRDQTDRNRIEAELRAGEQRFRALAEAVPQMLWTARGDDGSVDYFSPRWEEFTGRPVRSLLGAGFVELIHADDLAVVASATDPEHRHAPVVYRMLRHDGQFRWLEARMHGIEREDGTVERWVGATLDITERVEADEEARKRQEQLRATLKLTGYGTYVWNVKEDRFSRDSQLEEVLGIPMEGMMTADGFDQFFALVHPDDRDRTAASVIGALEPGGPDYDAEFRMLTPGPDGPVEKWVSAMGRVEFDERGEAVRLVGVFADITDKRREDEGRLRIQKLEAIGTLASGIAHDFNNVIGAILSYARVAEAELKAGVSPAESIGEIARGAHRAGDIVQRLLTFSRDEEPRREAFDLAAVAEEALSLVRPTVPARIDIRADVAPPIPRVFGNPTQFHQVVVNLLTNAAQAIGAEPGTITLSIGAVGIDEQRGSSAPGEYLQLVCEDDGPGMSDAVAQRAFDPFFTTKLAGRGTGLGLAAVQSIIDNHGGSITLETREGAGTRLVILVPAQQGGGPGPGTDAPGSPSEVAARVLFVDDEQALVRLAHRAMPYHGCSVTGHTDPLLAAGEFEADPSAFDALVTDLSMPGMTGLELTDRVRALRPDLPVVITSGFMGAAERAQAEARGVDAIIPKPCAIDDLAEAVHRLLIARRA